MKIRNRPGDPRNKCRSYPAQQGCHIGAIGLALMVTFSGCQAPGTSWLPNVASFARPGSSANDSMNDAEQQQFDNVPTRQVINQRRPVMDSITQDGATRIQLTGYQEPAATPKRFLPDPVLQSRRHSPGNNRPQMGTRSPNGYGVPDTGEGVFYAEEAAQTIPMSASELVIELGGNLATIRKEVSELRQTVDRLAQDNKLLRETRDELSIRLSRLETELTESREREFAVRQQFDQLGQRMQQFNSRRQNQIMELNNIIDQLETQLKIPAAEASIVNPYRNTSHAEEK